MNDEITNLQARVKVLEDALRSAQASIATFIGVHGYPTDSGACDVLNEVTAALAASQPADPVTNASCCQPVRVKPAPVRGVVMAEKLKPCPFCGGDDLYFPHGTDPAVIECSGCGARSGVPDDQTEVEATAKWNARVAPSLRITGPNSDGEYWLHIKAGGRSGGVNLGGEHGPICKRLLDAASETGAKE